MPSLPTGTVTFLFTDIEGSTHLIQQLGDAGYARVLDEHCRVLRAAFEARGGHEIETQGDGFLVAFQGARAAILAAVDAQQSLAALPWPEGAALRVRMGLHTGEPVVTAGRYVGLDVHRAARICQTGWGGQILLSGTTTDVLEHSMPDGLGLVSLGEHHLKDLRWPEHIHQLLHPDLPRDFPPLRSLDRLPNNLPRHLTSFVGRTREMAEVKRLLRTTQLLTLTGSGGCGKTRLALQVAADLVDAYRDGVWMADLASLSDPTLVPQTVATAVRVREQPGRSLVTTIADHLRNRHLLLVFDGCEHLVVACAHLSDALLRVCPSVTILATSRESLGIGGEIAWRVPSLGVPERSHSALERIDEFEAVRLFVERASAALPGFEVTPHNAPAVVEICRQLDGIPLALELAASRVKAMALDHIASRLGDRMRLLTGGSRTAPPRQQTLRATIDWSHELLSPKEQIVFRRLSVFAGGWTPDGAEAVCAGNGLESDQILDLLTRLVDKSLVMTATDPDGSGEGRYWPLETIREYAGVRLRESGDDPVVRRRHRDYFLALAQQSEPSLRGPSQSAWYARLRAEMDNFRAVLAWCGQDPESHEAGLSLAGSLWWFWFTQGALSEARRWLEDALARGGPQTPRRASALYGTGAVAWNQGDLVLAERCAGEALVLCREFGDRLGTVYCLSIQGAVSMLRGQHGQAATMLEEALGLCRASGHRWETAMVLGLLGWAADQRGDPAAAVGLCRESLSLFRAEGDRWGQGTVLAPLGRALRHRGAHAQAMALLEESVTLTRELGSRRQLALSLHELALVSLATGETGRAAALEREALTLSREDEAQWGIAESLEGSAALAMVSGQPERAARLLGAAGARREAISAPRPVPEESAHAHTTAALARALGRDQFDVAWHQGQTMSRTQAIEDALAVFTQTAETEPPGASGDPSSPSAR